MKTNLNQIEKDFIEFVSKKRNRSYREIEDIFIATKERFKFAGPEYEKVGVMMHYLFKILHDDVDEKELVGAYQFHALTHLFRFISYSYPRPKQGCFYYLRVLMRSIIKGEFNKLFSFIKRKALGYSKVEGIGPGKDNATIAKFLVEKINKPPVVVDYGCGLGYVSFEIGRLVREAKIYLLDIDCLTLEFAEFRFKKYGIDVEIIPVTKNDIYPKLPVHNICIATQIMEHLKQPLAAYQNIYNSLEQGGILYGTFEDFGPEMFHVSPDLSKLRKEVGKNFERISDMCYKKIK